MPLQPFQLTGRPNAGAYDYIGNALDTYRSGKNARIEDEKMRLEHALMQKYAAPMKEAEVEKTRAEAARAPFVGLTGPVANYNSLNQVKKIYGENSKQAKEAQEVYDLDKRNTESMVNSRDEYAKTLGVRISSPEVKRANERHQVSEGRDPASGRKLSPKEQSILSNELDLAQLKSITDPNTRAKAILAINMDKATESYNPINLVRYSGPIGAIQKKIQQGLALSGKESEEYRLYREAVVGAEAWKTQVRQFYGDSISPEKDKQLESLTNPEHIASNPELALREYQQFSNILKMETDTYRDALYTTKGLVPEEGRYQEQPQPMNFNNAIGMAAQGAPQSAPDWSNLSVEQLAQIARQQR
jgi:hypothetical protein